MLISAIEMWTKFKNKLLKSKSRRLMKTGPPSTTNEWDEVFRPEVRSNKDERSTRSTMERNRRKSTRNGFFFSFGRFRQKKEESSAGSGNVDRKKITGNDVTVVSGDTPPKTGSRPVRPQLKDRKPDGSGNGNGNGEDGGGDDDRVTSAEVESLETSPRETGSSPVATDLPTSFADYPVWIHRVWDEDGDDEGRESTPAAGDPQPSNGVMSTFLGRSGGHDPLTANCAATVRASPPRLKRRKKPVPAPSSTDESESRETHRPGEGSAATSGTPEVQVPSPRAVAPPRVPNRGGGGGARDEFSVRLERSLDELTSAGNGNEEDEEEEEEEGGRLKAVEGGFEWGRFYAPEPNSAAGLTLEKHSPDLTSSDDSTEGKESGYVTLEDLQAQLAGGSSSSSSSSSSSCSSSSWSNNVVDGERSRIKIPFQSTQPSSTVRSLDAVPAAPHRPTPASSSPSPSSAHHSATWCGPSADDDGGGGGGKMTSDDVIASSFLKFTFTVKLESEMFRRRTSEREDNRKNDGVKYRCTGPKGRELVGAGGHRGDLAAAAGDQDPNRAEERKELYTGSCSFPQNRNKNVCSDDAVPVDTSSPKSFACSACSQAVGDVSQIATMTSDDVDVDENVAMTTPSSFQVARLRDVSSRTAVAEARKFPRKQQTGRLPLSELHDNGMWRQPEPEMDCFDDDDDDDGFYLRPLSTTKRNIIADNNNTYRVTETPKCRGKFDEEEKKKKKKRGNLDEEVTHMTWDEVLVEAKSLGIHLQPPSKSPSGFSTTRNLDSSGAVLGTRTGSESATSGGTRFRSRKTGSSKSIRDLFRIQNVFTSSSSSGGSNKENHRRDDVTVTGSRSTGRRIRSSSPPPPPPPEDVGSIQRRRLPPPPPSPDMEEEEDERWFSRRTSVSTQACRCGSSRSRDCYLDNGVGVGVGVGGGWGSIGSWWGGGGCRGCAEEEEEEDRRRMCVCSSSVSVSSMGSRCSSVATATPVIIPSDGHRTPDSGLVSSFRRQRRNQNGLLGTCLEQLQNCSWYWGSLSFEEAEERLANRPDGTFLVRDSSDERYLLSLSFTSLHSTHHTRIEHYKGMFSFYSQPMTSNRSATSIVEFIDDAVFASRGGHCLYYLRPRGPGQPPTPVRLLHPLSRFRYMHSLQHLSKFAVLRHVRRDLVDRLPLSPRLKEYLKSIH